MDTQTRHALKGDKFAQATKTSVSWLSGHRVRCRALGDYWCGACGSVPWRSHFLECAIGCGRFRSGSGVGHLFLTSGPAGRAAGEGHLRNIELSGPRRRISSLSRWRSSMAGLPEGTKAHYFAGITYEELGQNGPAESELKAAADSWDRNLSNLSKLALAGLYRKTGEDAKAIDLYNAIIAKPSVTVSASVAQLDLADLYAASRQAGPGAGSVGQSEGRRQGWRGRHHCHAKTRRAVGPLVTTWQARRPEHFPVWVRLVDV